MKFWIKAADEHNASTVMFSNANDTTAEMYWFMGTCGIKFTKPELKFLPTGHREHIILAEFDLPHEEAMMMRLRFPFIDVEAEIRRLEEEESNDASTPDRKVTIRLDKIRAMFDL